MLRRLTVFTTTILLLGTGVESQPAGSIRGFTAQGSESQRRTEETFRAVPKPAKLREYMPPSFDGWGIG